MGAAAKTQYVEEEDSNEGNTENAPSPEGVPPRQTRIRNEQPKFKLRHIAKIYPVRKVFLLDPIRNDYSRRPRIEEEYTRDRDTKSTSDAEAVPIRKIRVGTRIQDTEEEKEEKLHRRYYDQWGLKDWSTAELDFESDLERKTDTPRLLDDPDFQHNLHLWAFLLDYRQKKDGLDGVAVFWVAFRARNANMPPLPVQDGALSEKIWMSFLPLGFENPAVMEDICLFANETFASHGTCWTKLYPKVLLHFLLNGTYEEALHWHQRLFPLHTPNETPFYEMCRLVVLVNGNIPALQAIYKDAGYGKLYGRIVPKLCRRNNFQDALMWHDFLVEHGDLPKSISTAEPLIRHLQNYDIYEAQRVIKSLASLVDSAMSVAPDYSDRFRDLKDIDTNKADLGGIDDPKYIEPNSADLEELKHPETEQDVIDNSPIHPLQVSKRLQKEQPDADPPTHPLQEVSNLVQVEQKAINPFYNECADVQEQVHWNNPIQNPSLDELDDGAGLTARTGDVQPTKHTHISREMMNMIHGEHYGIKPASYNDQLGARWFASSWVSLDLAISVIHALGVHEIGPLSLHAIALREPGARDVSMRIKQLKDLGISIGNSVFSLAVKYFAQKREDVYLESLLSSDQHPSEYENFELQENLLLEYLHARDWIQYRRTLAILSFRSSAPECERANTILRTHVRRQDLLAIYDTLALMKQHGQKVSGRTVAHIIRLLLAPRKPGHRPDLNHDINIRQTIGILKTLASSASQVRPRSWIEILRRLGMLGQFRDLEHLCLFLVDAYHPSNPESAANYDILPPDAKNHHYGHPYRMMFSPAFQKAVVEWGFIHPLKIKSFRQISQVYPPGQGPDAHTFYNDGIPMPDVTFGIRLLKTLASKGVWVDFGPIRKAVVHRMIVCYGPLKSGRRYNRNAKITLGLHESVSPRQSFRKMAAMVDDALGANVFAGLDIERLIDLRVRKVVMKRMRKKMDKMKKRMRGLDGLRRELR